MASAYTSVFLLNDLMLTALCYLYIFAIIAIFLSLRKKGKISKFTARKGIHLLTGLVVLLVPFFSFPFGRFWAVLIASSMTIVVFKSEKNSKIKVLGELYQAIGEEAEEKLSRSYLQGPFHYSLAITLLISIFTFLGLWKDQIYLPISCILIMVVSDSLASVAGKKYGKRKINLSWTGTTRTLEGSLMFLVTAFFLAFFSFFVFGFLYKTISLNAVVVYAIATAVVSTLIELASPSTWDDLTVPIISTMVMWVILFFY